MPRNAEDLVGFLLAIHDEGLKVSFARVANIAKNAKYKREILYPLERIGAIKK